MDAYRTNCRCGRVTPGITNRREFLCARRRGLRHARARRPARPRQPPRRRDQSPPDRWPRSRPTIAARARSVIWLFMEGGPSAMDTFDPKPELTRHHGQTPEMPIDVFFGSPGPLMKSPFAFAAAWRQRYLGLRQAAAHCTARRRPRA